MDSWKLGAAELAAAVAAKKISCRQATELALARIARVEPKLQALMRVHGDEALARAAGLDARLARGEPLGPLGGVPVILKDNLCWAGHVASCSSKILENYRPPYTAHVVERLLAARAGRRPAARRDRWLRRFLGMSRIMAISPQSGNSGQRRHSAQTRWGSSERSTRRKPSFSKKPGT